MYTVFSFVLTHVKIKNVNEFRQDAIHKLVISENNKPATSRKENMLLKPNKNKNSQQPLITTNCVVDLLILFLLFMLLFW